MQHGEGHLQHQQGSIVLLAWQLRQQPRGIPTMRPMQPTRPPHQPACVCADWLALDSTSLFIGCPESHMTAYANGLYVAVEIPER